jgi:ATP-dependent protease ClpP protease subunit
LFSPGGSVFAGMVLFDHIVAMREKGWHFTTISRGYAASMGGILLQAGDVRVCGPESYILIHEISTGAVGKIGELEDTVEFTNMIQKRVNDIFVSRSGGKVTSSKLRAMYRRKDFWLDSSKSLSLGIVDEIR